MERLERSGADVGEVSEGITAALETQDDVVAAYLHGSLVDTDGARFRDVDIAVVLAGHPPPDVALERELTLEGVVSRTCPYPVDLRVINHAPLAFCYKAMTGGKRVFVGDDEARARFEEMTWSRYQDVRYHLETYQREAYGLGA